MRILEIIFTFRNNKILIIHDGNKRSSLADFRRGCNETGCEFSYFISTIFFVCEKLPLVNV